MPFTTDEINRLSRRILLGQFLTTDQYRQMTELPVEQRDAFAERIVAQQGYRIESYPNRHELTRAVPDMEPEDL